MAAAPALARNGAGRAASWLRGTQMGLVVTTLGVGVGAGLGAVVFRELIFGFTWLATGHANFGQAGRVPSLHVPGLGIWFIVLIPVVGGLLYGPLIHFFAREARGHGVPEVMIAVAENGGRIRARVSGVKAVASALCIGVGGSVGREGPIVQIGSALASSIGQAVRMPESRLRILVACGTAGGISATFNAPITGVFFGFELILREFSIDALFPIILSAMVADVVSRQFFGSGPFLAHMPHGLTVDHVPAYFLVLVLGLAAGLVGVGFKSVLYRAEDACDAAWRDRPEWLRPAAGGLLLGLLLLAMPQMYGVGYPVMDRAVSGHYVFWFLLLLAGAKVLAASLTIGIGGSGGVFAPSLFTGAAAGTAFGLAVQHLFGGAAGSPAIYGMVGMGAVFGAAAQAPLTAIASVLEMTGDFPLTLAVMLGVGLATALSKKLTYGTIYTTKLLRRGTDIDRPRPASVLHQLTVADAMQPLPVRPLPGATGLRGKALSPPGRLVWAHEPQVLFPDERLSDGLRQLVLYGPGGLPVLDQDGETLVGWITGDDVANAVVQRLDAAAAETKKAVLAAQWGENGGRPLRAPATPLDGYEILEFAIGPDSPAAGCSLAVLKLPAGYLPVACSHRGRTRIVDGETTLTAGDRLTVLAPRTEATEPAAVAAPPPIP
jgi:CIC family chloride channel protein